MDRTEPWLKRDPSESMCSQKSQTFGEKFLQNLKIIIIILKLFLSNFKKKDSNLKLI